MNQLPFFSVVIPVHNQEKLVRHTLDSVLSQRMNDYEIIVVNDGSDDSTSVTLKDYDNKIIIIEQENKGPGHARNTAIAHAQGKYVAFLDSDDLWFPWTLEIFYSAIKKHNFPAIISGSHVDINSDSDIDYISEKSCQYLLYKDYLESVRDMLWLGMSATVIRRDILKGCSTFSSLNINSEDNDLMLSLGTAPGFVYIQGPPLFAYRRRTDSRVSEIGRSIAGSYYLIEQENSGSYPGGKERQCERWYMLGRHLRKVINLCIKNYRLNDAWKLYCAIFKWNIYFNFFSYIVKVPALILIGLVRRAPEIGIR